MKFWSRVPRGPVLKLIPEGKYIHPRSRSALVMDDFWRLVVLSLSMFIGCYVAGSIPLILSLSEVRRVRTHTHARHHQEYAFILLGRLLTHIKFPHQLILLNSAALIVFTLSTSTCRVFCGRWPHLVQVCWLARHWLSSYQRAWNHYLEKVSALLYQFAGKQWIKSYIFMDTTTD